MLAPNRRTNGKSVAMPGVAQTPIRRWELRTGLALLTEFTLAVIPGGGGVSIAYCGLDYAYRVRCLGFARHDIFAEWFIEIG